MMRLRRFEGTPWRHTTAALLCGTLCSLGPSGAGAMGAPTPVFPSDLSTYKVMEGAISRVDFTRKPPAIEFTNAQGEKYGLVVPPTAFITLNGKLVRANKLRRGQTGKVRWRVENGEQVVGTLELVPRAKSKIDLLKPEGMPKIPKPDLSRPNMPKIPSPTTTAAPVIRELMPTPPPAPSRPVMPPAPSTQELRR
jgi:hypothetical protein